MPLLSCERSGMATAADPACPLFEVHPEPELDADIVGIEVIFPDSSGFSGAAAQAHIGSHPR